VEAIRTAVAANLNPAPETEKDTMTDEQLQDLKKFIQEDNEARHQVTRKLDAEGRAADLQDLKKFIQADGEARHQVTRTLAAGGRA